MQRTVVQTSAIPVNSCLWAKPRDISPGTIKNALEHTLYKIPALDFHFQPRSSNSYQIHLQHETNYKAMKNVVNNSSHDNG